MRKLNKTTIIIWSDPDLTHPEDFELEDLAREADSGLAYCSSCTTETVLDPEKDSDWDGTEFFDDFEEEED